MIPVATFGIEPAALGERFQKRGFAATVLADEEGDLAANRPNRPSDAHSSVGRTIRTFV